MRGDTFGAIGPPNHRSRIVWPARTGTFGADSIPSGKPAESLTSTNRSHSAIGLDVVRNGARYRDRTDEPKRSRAAPGHPAERHLPHEVALGRRAAERVVTLDERCHDYGRGPSSVAPGGTAPDHAPARS